MNRRNRSGGLSPLIAVVLLVAITVAASVVISGIFFNLVGIAGRRPSAIIDQVRLVATPAGRGTWAVVVKNTGDLPITEINATFPAGTCDPDLTFRPLPANPGSTTSAADSDNGCTLGSTYTIILIVEFEDNSTQILTTQATAALA